MSVIVISLFAFLAVCTIFIVVYRMLVVAKDSRNLNKRLEFWLSEQSSIVRNTEDEKKEEPEEDFTKRVLLPIGEQVGEWLSNKTSFNQQSNIIKQLIAAGYRDKSAIDIFYGIKLFVAIFLGILAFVLIGVFGKDINIGILATLCALGAGFIIPQIFLDNVMASRKAKINLVLPDALDLLVICAEAGMSIDMALLRVASSLGTTGKSLSEEIVITNREISLGVSRDECWSNLGERTGSDELKSLARVISQSEKVGASIGGVLRAQSDFMREKRKQNAEKAAAQMAVKMMIPTIIFIFPCILVVTFGPPILKFMHSYKT